MKHHCLILAGCVLAAGSLRAAEPTEPTDAIRLREMQSMLDRVHSNELRRLRLDLDVERLNTEKTRLESDRARWDRERQRLEREITNLQDRVVGAERPAPKPGLYVSLGDATLRCAGGPSAEVPPMTVVDVVAVTNGRLQVLRGGTAHEADPSDFSAEPELIAHLEARAARHSKQLAQAQAEAAQLEREAASAGASLDTAARARVAREEAENAGRQMRRSRTAIEHVKKALADHRAGATAAPAQP